MKLAHRATVLTVSFSHVNRANFQKELVNIGLHLFVCLVCLFVLFLFFLSFSRRAAFQIQTDMEYESSVTGDYGLEMPLLGTDGFKMKRCYILQVIVRDIPFTFLYGKMVSKKCTLKGMIFIFS